MCGITDPGGCVAAAAHSGLEAMAEALADAAGWMITESFTWWIDTDGQVLNTGIVNAVREVTMPLTVSVAAAGMILLGIRMVLSGSHDPLLSMGEGIAKLVFWTVAGTTVLTTLMQAASAFSGWVLDEGSSRKLGVQLLTAFDRPIKDNVGLVLLLSLLGFLAGLAQWVISLFREGALVILAGCLPLAASGQLGLGEHWLRKIAGWCLALIFWQPAASLVYFAAFAMMENASGPQEMLVGITMLIIAIFALPMLMKLFTWVVTPGGGGGGAGGSSRLAAVALGQQMRTSRGGGRMSPGQHARLVDSSLPRQGGTAGGGTPSGGGRSGPPSGSAPGGGSGTSPTAKGAVPGPRAPASGATAAKGPGSPWAPPGGVSGGSASAGSAGRSASGAGAAPGAGATSGAASGAGGAVSAGGPAAGAGGAAGSAGAGAGGARAAAVAGPIGAAAAAAVMVSAAGAKAAGRAMTEGADTPPPPPSNSGSRKDAK
ncbi:hypothetical protein QNO07_26125 [Streptomyces sp. 549]|uniref:hypothetical protein n=1 Tax=Streptomyces sp. 549 TaxID=3049076 RepID=UPI0024C37874|nr:hypothetical protein [Streptomyces sp. 549]MDK1476838.1 hypothetical protein [Streptomyces sp. 549]